MIIRIVTTSIAICFLLHFFLGLPKPANAISANSLTSKMIIFSEGNEAGIGVSDDDPVPTGAKFRLHVSTDQDLEVDITMETTDGKSVILKGHQIKTGSAEVLPGRGEWFSVPESEGPQTVSVSSKDDGGKIVTSSHSYLVGKVNIKKTSSISELSNLSPIASAGLSSRKQILSQISGLSRNSFTTAISYTSDLVKSAAPDLPLSFRGSGVQVFTETSSSVVKVLTNEGSGSGSILSSKGVILTNWHVIQGYKSVGIRFKPKNKMGVSNEHIFIADVARVDEVSDLALLTLRDDVGKLPVITLSKISEPEVGSNVHAIGHPQGQNWTYTRGYISQIRKDFKWAADEMSFHRATVIQTQTPINPGNSGGPLLNDEGELVGVNSFIRTDSEGINYAVSLIDIKKLISAKAHRWIERPKIPENYEFKEDAVLRMIDKNKNGVIDTTLLDLDGNGIPDLFAMDENEDGIMDYFLVDADENGKEDAVVKPVQKDGQLVYIWAVDNNEDGKPDAYCVDVDRDWEVDKCRKA
jgi:S1-C subfamily serine protease